MTQGAQRVIKRNVWSTINRNRARIQQSQDFEERERLAILALKQSARSGPTAVSPAKTIIEILGRTKACFANDKWPFRWSIITNTGLFAIMPHVKRVLATCEKGAVG